MMKIFKRILCLILMMAVMITNSISALTVKADAKELKSAHAETDTDNIETKTVTYDDNKKIKINNSNFEGLTAFAKKQDKDGDGYLSMAELLQVVSIENDMNRDGKVDIKITGLGGIENFPNLHSVSLLRYSKSKLTIPKNSSVEWVTLYDVNTKSLKIDAPGVKSIELLSKKYSFKGKLKKIDISNCSNTVQFKNNYCTDRITQLKLPKVKNKLKSISLNRINRNSLDLSMYRNLQEVTMLDCSIKSINLSKCTNLLYVYFYLCKNLTSVNAGKAAKLRYLNWYSCASLKKSGIKTAGKGKIAGGVGTYWTKTSKYQKFLNELYS